MRKRKICVVSGSRADYGYIKSLMVEIKNDSALRLQLVVTGMHLSPKYGLFYKTIERDGFAIDKKLPILKYDNSDAGITKSLGLGCQLFAGAFRDLNPDIVVLLGDRYEMLSAAIAAYIGKTPLAHIGAGESTEGQIDEGIRHSITKMASVQFTSTAVYRKRVIQMGENPKHVYMCGTAGLDLVRSLQLLNKEELAGELGVDFNSGTVAICTYHPVTLRQGNPRKDIEHMLNAIRQFPFKVIFTQSNADPAGNIINDVLKKFCQHDPKRYKFFKTLGSRLYYSCLKHCGFMIGNSSSGLIEAPSFHLPVVNIGERQQNRVRGKNVIDAACNEKDIRRAVAMAISDKFRATLKKSKNPYDPYGDGKAGFRIKERLKQLNLDGILMKHFFDL